MTNELKCTYRRNIIILWIVIVILNLVAWLIPGVCDWYTYYVTPIWVNTYGRFSNIFSFSLGEIMLVLGMFLVIATIVVTVLFIFLRKRDKFNKFVKHYYKVTFCIVSIVCLVMTLNCTMLYHCEPLDPNPEVEYRKYTLQELEILRNYIVEQCNIYSNIINRDENGYIQYDGDMEKTARQSLQNISDKYPKLKGYYPNVKHMFFSNLMSQAYMAGYYFPFSMEANCNGKMYIVNYPETYCHELSHLHGYIYEDEANFLSYLACVESNDDLFVYSGYLGVLNYVDNAYWNSIGEDIAYYLNQPRTNDLVDRDNIFLLNETWEQIESTAVFATETVDEFSTNFTNVSLQLNGVKEGMASYSEVVDLLLQYYDGILY